MVPFIAGLGGTGREWASRPSREWPRQPYCTGVDGSRRYGTGPAHNPKVAGSNPAPATNEIAGQARRASAGPSACGAGFGADIANSRRERGAAHTRRSCVFATQRGAFVSSCPGCSRRVSFCTATRGRRRRRRGASPKSHRVDNPKIASRARNDGAVTVSPCLIRSRRPPRARSSAVTASWRVLSTCSTRRPPGAGAWFCSSVRPASARRGSPRRSPQSRWLAVSP